MTAFTLKKKQDKNYKPRSTNPNPVIHETIITLPKYESSSGNFNVNVFGVNDIEAIVSIYDVDHELWSGRSHLKVYQYEAQLKAKAAHNKKNKPSTESNEKSK